MKIATSHVYPPIPARDFDWCAYAEGHEEDGLYGYGRTEAEAVDDFIENHAEEYEEAERAQREREADARHNGGLSPLGTVLVASNRERAE